MPLKPTVIIVDDNSELRESLRWLLESVGHRVETYATAHEFLEHYDARKPGCLVLDVRMPGMSGTELQNCLKELGAELHILFLTGHASVSLAVQVMREGAVDLFEKPVDEQLFLDRIQQLLDEIRAKLAERAKSEVVEARLALLTPREREVMELVVAGKRTKNIAADLNLSPKTVDAHRANIMEKMRTRSVAELVSVVMGHQPVR